MCACEHIRLIGSYHDGELSPDEARQIEAHLAQCEVCARELRELRGLSRALGGARAPEMPPEVGRRLHETVAAARVGGVVRLAKELTAVAATILVACAAWIVSSAAAAEAGPAQASPWETAAVTLRMEITGETQQTAQWIMDNLSAENGHD